MVCLQIETKSEKQECSSDMRFGGQMCIKSYIHGKATVGEACQVLKVKRIVNDRK